MMTEPVLSRNSEPTSGAALKPSWNPLKCDGTGLPVNLTILVKALALVLLLTNHVRLLPDPWLPFIPSIDLIPPALFQRTLQTVFILSAMAILFNRRLRIASLILGGTMLLAVVSSKAYYGNNKTFCGLMLFLAGLYKPGGYPFLRWQLALTYFGAGLNKALDGDWHSGVFFQNWAVNRLHQTWYLTLDRWLPPMFLARFMCWTTIITELGVVPCLLLPQLYYWGILANILFQASLVLFTGTTFTVFFYSMSAASLAFVEWPATQVSVLYDPNDRLALFAKRFLQPWDVDKRFLWSPNPSERDGDANPKGALPSKLSLVASGKVYSKFRALRMIVLLNPVTYFVIAGSIAAVEVLAYAPLYRRAIVAVSLLFLLPPLAWIADNFPGGGDSRQARTMPSGSGDPIAES
jgi:hypothetical protein